MRDSLPVSASDLAMFLFTGTLSKELLLTTSKKAIEKMIDGIKREGRKSIFERKKLQKRQRERKREREREKEGTKEREREGKKEGGRERERDSTCRRDGLRQKK